MFRKFALIAFMSLTALIGTPSQAKAYIPIAEVILGVQLVSALVVAAEPLVKIAFKAVKKGTELLVAYVQRKRAPPPEIEEEEILLRDIYRGFSARLKFEELDEDYFGMTAPAA